MNSCLIVILCRYRPLFKCLHLFYGDPDPIPDADRLDFSGIDHPINGSFRYGKVGSDFIDPVVPFREGAGSGDRSFPFFSRL